MEVPSEQPFSEEQARLYFRDIVLGIEYCEYPSTGSALQRVCLGPCTAGEGHLDTGRCWMSQRSPRIASDGVDVEVAPLSSGLPRKCHRTLRKDIREIAPLFFSSICFSLETVLEGSSRARKWVFAVSWTESVREQIPVSSFTGQALAMAGLVSSTGRVPVLVMECPFAESI